MSIRRNEGARFEARWLIAPLAMEISVVPTDAAAGFNYGLDKVRFPAPVKAGARGCNHLSRTR